MKHLKHITIITHAPQGTLGDPSLCTTLAENLQKQHPDLKIKIVIARVDKPGHWRAIDNVIKHNDNLVVEYIPLGLDSLTYLQKEELYDNTDGVIIYPTFHLLNHTEKLEFEKLRQKIPVLFITNYNFQMQQDYNNVQEKFSKPTSEWISTYEELLERNFIIETGIGLKSNGEKLAGVNLSDTERDKSIHLDGKDRLNLNDTDLKSLRGIMQLESDEILDNDVLAKYKSQNDLYFGYYNNLPVEASNNWANAANFVKLAVLDSMQKNQKKKNIDIVIPLIDTEDSKISGNNFENIKSKLDLTKFTVEVWEKDPGTGELVKNKSEGNGPTTVRLINPFPIAKPMMDLMHRMSDPLTLMTGNSSILEAIEYDKIPLYQILYWHTRLDQDLLNAISSEPPFYAEHPYRQFHEMIRSTDSNKDEKLAKMLNENKEKILEGAKIFHSFVTENYSLKEKLSKEVLSKIEFQQQSLKNQKSVNETGGEIKLPFNDYNMRYEDNYINFKEHGILDASSKNDLLLLAFIRNDLSMVRNLLKEGADPNYTAQINGNNYNPLYFCINHRLDEKLLKELHNSDSFDPVECMKTIRETLAPKPNITLGESADQYTFAAGELNTTTSYINPYESLQNAVPKHQMLEMLIQSAKKSGKDPNDLFEQDEIRKFYFHPGTYPYFDIIYLDILIREDIITPNFNYFYDIGLYYNLHHEYKYLEKDKWQIGLKNFYQDESMVLRLLESGYHKYKNDHAYLREVLLTQEYDGSNLLSNLMIRYADNDLLESIAKQILSDEENKELHFDLERKKTAIDPKTQKLNAQLEQEQTVTAHQSHKRSLLKFSEPITPNTDKAQTSEREPTVTVKNKREKEKENIKINENKKPKF